MSATRGNLGGRRQLLRPLRGGKSFPAFHQCRDAEAAALYWWQHPCVPLWGPSGTSGAFFTISRKLPGQTSFTGVGGAPGTTNESRRASFTDSSVPATAASNGAQYIVQEFRGTRVGTPSDALTVQFGTDGGSFISGSNAATSIKMAA